MQFLGVLSLANRGPCRMDPALPCLAQPHGTYAISTEMRTEFGRPASALGIARMAIKVRLASATDVKRVAPLAQTRLKTRLRRPPAGRQRREVVAGGTGVAVASQVFDGIRSKLARAGPQISREVNVKRVARNTQVATVGASVSMPMLGVVPALPLLPAASSSSPKPTWRCRSRAGGCGGEALLMGCSGSEQA